MQDDATDSIPDVPPTDWWVFGYGSLMWKPGFAAAASTEARLYGHHRALCIRSVIHRGTPERPGLVLGLDQGGLCTGRAYRVAVEHGAEVMAYLHAREMPNDAYVPSWLEIELLPGSERVRALAYVARRDHWQYVTGESVQTQAETLAVAHGKGGSGIDYLDSTLTHLAEFGIEEPELQAVLDAAKAYGRRQGDAGEIT